MSEKDAGQDMSERKPDLLAEVRAVGKRVRDVLASNMQARIGDVVEMEVLTETADVMASVLQTYLAQIVPEVRVKALVHIRPCPERPERIEFELQTSGTIVLSIELGAEDDSLPDPEPGAENLEEPPKT